MSDWSSSRKVIPVNLSLLTIHSAAHLFVRMFALLLSLLAFNPFSAAQTSVPPDTTSETGLIVSHIIVEGNHKTKEPIILRELDIAIGDTIFSAQSAELLIRNRNKIFNTNLFVSVDVQLRPIDAQHAYMFIIVAERWYIFPMVIVGLADRNFNEWWTERDRDLSRTYYGLQLVHRNFRGRQERIKVAAQFGFTKRFELNYTIPYINRAQKYGIGFDMSYDQNKSTFFRTFDNKLAYVEGEAIIRNRLYAGIRLTRRNRFYVFHTLEARFHRNEIGDTIARLNPNYFLDGNTLQRYFRLSYNFLIDRRDIAAYPLHGHLFNFRIARAGITPAEDLHLTTLTATYSLYRELGKKFYWMTSLRGKTSAPSRQPYNHFQSFGFGQDYVRGYEYYVIDGQHYGLAKFTVKRELFKTQRHLPSLVPMRQFQTIPLAIYVKAYADAGYVANQPPVPENNRLVNKMLYGGGLGVDIVTFYNLVIRLDYSINRDLERGFFLHFAKDI